MILIAEGAGPAAQAQPSGGGSFAAIERFAQWRVMERRGRRCPLRPRKRTSKV